MTTGAHIATAASIDRNSFVPLYSQLSAQLLKRIESEWEVGDKMPSEAELCATYGVSRTVVRQAMDQLVAEGKVAKTKGVGAFVNERRMDSTFIQRAAGFYDEMRERGHEVRSRTLKQRIVPAPPQAMAKLGLPAHSRVVEFHRLRFVDDVPAQVVRAWLPLQRFAGLELIDMTNRSLYHVLAEKYGCLPVSGHRTIAAATAEPGDAKLLQIREDSPVLIMQSLTQDAAGIPFEWFNAVYRSDRFQFDIELITSRS